MRNQPAPLSATDEQDLAQQIVTTQEELLRLLRGTPARTLLDPGRDRAVRTRHAAVTRLSAAVEAARAMPLAPQLWLQILKLWHHAQAMMWQLALSAIRVARSEARRAQSAKVSVEDLEQESVLGLLAAAKRYEPGRGVRFSVYARWWVRAQITRAIQLAEAFGIGASAQELHRNLKKLIHSDEMAGKRRSTSELARALGVAPKRLRSVTAAISCHAVVDLEGEGAEQVISQIPDTDGRTPEEATIDADTARSVRAVIATKFNEREQHILHHRFGLSAEHTSADTIARTLSLSTERVRQLEHQCVSALRSIFEREMDV